MDTVTPQGRVIAPVENYRAPEDVCANCARRWATWSVLDLLSVFGASRLCDACISDMHGAYELLPYTPRLRNAPQ